MTGADAPIGVAVLAAGGSTRLGRPKQLLPWHGGTLLGHAAQVALDAALGPVVVVLGANAERCAAALADLPVQVAHCDHWPEGMAAGIRTATAAALRLQLGALILTTCDQPRVTADDLRRLAGIHRAESAALVASAYGETVGIPALFSRSRYADLEALRGDVGAKALLLAEGASLRTLPCPAAAFDVDLESDIPGL